MIKHIGLYANSQREDIRELCTYVVDTLQQHGISVYAHSDAALPISTLSRLDAKEFNDTVDLLLVIGGDGTFLRAAHLVGVYGIPMLGINKGHLGFLSELEEEEFFRAINDILAGRYNIESRMMISAEVYRKNTYLGRVSGLNDLVINRNRDDNTIACEVFLGEALVDRYSGDGLIVATPTGSTGYSLSAGGPLIYPGTDCLIVNPICSHFLGTRSVIVPADDAIDVVITRSNHVTYFVADGVQAMELLEGDRLHVTRAKEEIHLVHVREHPFFEAVRNKLLNRDYRKQ